jgi:hypothetical protein
VSEAASRVLSRQLKNEITRQVQSEHSALSLVLLSQILDEVNWTELADDLVTTHGGQDPRMQ